MRSNIRVNTVIFVISAQRQYGVPVSRGWLPIQEQPVRVAGVSQGPEPSSRVEFSEWGARILAPAHRHGRATSRRRRAGQIPHQDHLRRQRRV